MLDLLILSAFAIIAVNTGWWMVLISFVLTGIVKCIIIWIYPVCCMPLFEASYTRLDEMEEHVEIYEKLKELAESKGYDAEGKIVYEESYDADLHSNAVCTSQNIAISKHLLEHHKDHPDEILGIMAHELGHWDMMHVYREIPLETIYMVILTACVVPFLHDHQLLASFGFNQQSYVIAIFLIG